MCITVAMLWPLIAWIGGSAAALGILGEISWHLDDYTRDLPPSV